MFVFVGGWVCVCVCDLEWQPLRPVADLLPVLEYDHKAIVTADLECCELSVCCMCLCVVLDAVFLCPMSLTICLCNNWPSAQRDFFGQLLAVGGCFGVSLFTGTSRVLEDSQQRDQP